MGRHLLGPHVVGQRVVVRHVVRGETGPTGGPAMNDVLGVCRVVGAGPDGVVVIDRTGAPVEIAIADIVSGKPVPPRPSVRHRDSPRGRRAAHPRAVAGPGRRAARRVGAALRPAVRRTAAAAGQLGARDGRPRAAARRGVGRRAGAGTATGTGEPMVMAVAGLGRGVRPARTSAGATSGSGSAHCQVAGVAKALRTCDAVLAGRDGRRRPCRRVRTALRDARPPAAWWSRSGTVRRPGARRSTATGWCSTRSPSSPSTAGRGWPRGSSPSCSTGAASRGARTAMLQVETDNPAAIAALRAAGLRHPPHLPLPGGRLTSRQSMCALCPGGPRICSTTAGPDTSPAPRAAQRPSARPASPTRGRGSTRRRCGGTAT